MERLPEDRPVIIYTFHFNGFVLNHKLPHAFEGFHKFRIFRFCIVQSADFPQNNFESEVFPQLVQSGGKPFCGVIVLIVQDICQTHHGFECSVLIYPSFNQVVSLYRLAEIVLTAVLYRQS